MLLLLSYITASSFSWLTAHQSLSKSVIIAKIYRGARLYITVSCCYRWKRWRWRWWWNSFHFRWIIGLSIKSNVIVNRLLRSLLLLYYIRSKCDFLLRILLKFIIISCLLLRMIIMLLRLRGLKLLKIKMAAAMLLRWGVLRVK